MVAAGTVRTATEVQLVTVLGALDGFSTEPGDGVWMVTPPPLGKLPNRRTLIIGTPDGPISPDAVAAGHGPSVDAWVIPCGISCTDIPEVIPAKQAIEAAVNAVADYLAAHPRIGLANGPRDLRVVEIVGPNVHHEQGSPLMGWANFDIQAFADIERNQP
jgi:hypothetical protein